MNDKEDMSK